MQAFCLNPLLSEAGFSTHNTAAMAAAVRGGLNPLLSEAGFSTWLTTTTTPPRSDVLILF